MTPRSLLLALALAGLTVVPPPVDAAKPGLPLRHGRYVDAGDACLGAASTGRAWFGGGYAIQAPHAHCEATHATTQPDGRFVVVERCYENADRSLPYSVVNHVRLVSHTEFELTNQFGSFRLRWCQG